MAKNEPMPPTDVPAEEHVLGAMMISERAIEAVEPILTAADFYRESHGMIFTAILNLHGRQWPCDPLTVIGQLDSEGNLATVGGRDRIREIATLTPVASNAAHHARLVLTAAQRRRLIEAGFQISKLGWDAGNDADAHDLADQIMFQLGQERSAAGDPVSARELFDATYRRLEELAMQGTDIVGLPTGFRAVDKLTSGMRPGNVTLVAGRPSMGKSAFVFGTMLHLIRHLDPPVPVCLFTLEMTKEEIGQRMIAMDAMVNGQNVLNPGRMDRQEWLRVTDSCARLQDVPLYVVESQSITMTEIRSRARRLKTRVPDLGLIALDYIQLMTAGGKTENRNLELSAISRSLKLLAGELRVPIIVVSQLNRDVENRHDKRPQLADLRDSGSLEQDADVALFLYRDEYYYPDELETKGIAEVIIAKQRNGPVGTRKLAWLDQYAKFSDLATDMPFTTAPPEHQF